jgi:Flp pilus assembly protein TadG
MKKRIHTHPKQRGQSLVELGLSMIVLLFLLAGAINFGMAFYDYVAIRDAAQEGALYGSINPPLNINDRNEIKYRVQHSSDKPVDLKNDPSVVVKVCTCNPSVVNCQIEGNWSCDSDPAICPGYQLKVTVEYYCPVTMPIVGIFTDAIHLTASATSTILTSTTTSCP